MSDAERFHPTQRPTMRRCSCGKTIMLTERGAEERVCPDCGRKHIVELTRAGYTYRWEGGEETRHGE